MSRLLQWVGVQKKKEVWLEREEEIESKKN